MSAPAVVTASALPALVARAAQQLAGAKTSAEILEARDLASFAYDAAKIAARLSRAKQAHDDLIRAAHRAQADALEIEALAKRRLADEYDGAQARGEVATQARHGGSVPVGNTAPATVTDIGLTRKAIHEARQVRNAEKAKPGNVTQMRTASIIRSGSVLTWRPMCGLFRLAGTVLRGAALLLAWTTCTKRFAASSALRTLIAQASSTRPSRWSIPTLQLSKVIAHVKLLWMPCWMNLPPR